MTLQALNPRPSHKGSILGFTLSPKPYTPWLSEAERDLQLHQAVPRLCEDREAPAEFQGSAFEVKPYLEVHG